MRATLGREPDVAEMAEFLKYLQAREDRPVDGLQQLLWALITSPEMRFNF